MSLVTEAPHVTSAPPTLHRTGTWDREISRALGDRPVGPRAGVGIAGLFASHDAFIEAVTALPLGHSRRSLEQESPRRYDEQSALADEGVLYVALVGGSSRNSEQTRQWVRLDSLDLPDFERRRAEGWSAHSVVLSCGHEWVRGRSAAQPLPTVGEQTSCESSCDGGGRFARTVQAIFA